MSEDIKKEENRELTEEELNTWNEMYEKYKSELPKGVYQQMQKYCISIVFLTANLPIEAEEYLINEAQESINYMQEFLNGLSDLLKELREKEDMEVNDNE